VPIVSEKDLQLPSLAVEIIPSKVQHPLPPPTGPHPIFGYYLYIGL
jgi:hypothetical protein